MPNKACIGETCPTDYVMDNVEKKKIDQNTLQERWYDWFMIPEYHTGNKYYGEGDVKYEPCPKGSIPSYATDPVDNEKLSYLYDNKDDLRMCVSKSDYFGGKYTDSDSYCPIAWIYRAGATKAFLRKKYLEQIDVISTDSNETQYLGTLKKNINSIIEDEIYNPITTYGFKDTIREPQSTGSELACKILYEDSYKMGNALDICEYYKELDKEKSIEIIMSENEEDEKTATNRYLRTTQACHAVFCKSDDNLCFKSVAENEINNDPIKKEPEYQQIKTLDKTWYILANAGIVSAVFLICTVLLITVIYFKGPIYRLMKFVFKNIFRSLSAVIGLPRNICPKDIIVGGLLWFVFAYKIYSVFRK